MGEIGSLSDDQIDTSDIPEMDEKYFAVAKLVMPPGASKGALSLRLGADALDRLKARAN